MTKPIAMFLIRSDLLIIDIIANKIRVNVPSEMVAIQVLILDNPPLPIPKTIIKLESNKIAINKRA